jgi:LuxR family maltose regulon positive regulatory protein
VTLSGSNLALLQARTEGWAAGLRLAALWLQDQPDPTWAVAAFAGTDRTVADYLIAEIVDRQSPDVREFLLSTCIVDQISGELANALTGRQTGEQTLAALERAHAFITAVGTDRSWYRYHPLFAELLRFELRRRMPDDVAPLHQRAARWHAEHKTPIVAVRHALAAGDWAYSVELLTRYGLGLALLGETGAIRQLVERLRPEVVRDTPELDVLVAFDRVEALDHEASRQDLDLARRRLPRLPEHRRDRYRLLVALLELIVARRSGEFERVLAAGREIMELHVATAAQTVGEDDAVRSVALLNVGAAELWTGALDAAEGHVREAAHTAEHAGLARLQLEGLSLLAQVHVACGRLGVAYRIGRRAANLAEARGWSQDHRVGSAHLALASVALERSDLDAATRHIGAALTSCAAAPWRPVRLGVAIVHAWLCQARGAAAAGFAVLDTAREELAGWSPPPPSWLTDWLTVTEAELRTVSGDTGAARTLLSGLREHGAGPGAVSAPTAVALARLQLADGDAPGAMQTVAPWLNGTSAAGSPRPLVAAWMLHATAARHLGDGRATQSLEHALALAEPEGFRQVFADGGIHVRTLLTAHLATATSHRSFLGVLLNHTTTHAASVAVPELVEPLSERERDVLRYLPSRLSAGEIAADLYLSVHTVKSHLRNLYRKLQAANRREAVERARDLKLL